MDHDKRKSDFCRLRRQTGLLFTIQKKALKTRKTGPPR